MATRAAKKLTVNVLVLDEHGDAVLLTAGDEVPKECTDQVGEHCFVSPEPADDMQADSDQPAPAPDSE